MTESLRRALQRFTGRAARALLFVAVVGSSFLWIVYIGPESALASATDLRGLLVMPSDIGPDVTVESSEPLLPTDLFHGRSGIDDVKRANLVSGAEVLFRLPQSPHLRLLVQAYEFRTADWAKSVLAGKPSTSRADLASDAREAMLTNDRGRISAVQGTKGRIEFTVFVVSTDPAVSPDTAALRTIRDATFRAQYDRFPMRADLANTGDSPTREVGRHLALFLGTTAGVLFAAIALVSAIASLLRDRGSRELVSAMLLPIRRRRRIDPRAEVADDTGPVVRSALWAVLRWAVQTTALAAALGLLIWAPGLSIWWALGIFGVLLLLVSIARSYVFRERSGDASRLPALRYRLVLAFGTAASGLVLTGGIGMFVSALGGLWMGGGVGAIALLVPMALVGFSFMVLSRRVSRFFRRLAQPGVRQQVDADPRPPVLLLRSFSDDALEVRADAMSDSFLEALSGEAYSRFEESVAWALWRHGPVLAVGQPGTRIQPLGAARNYYSDDAWQAAVEDLSVEASALCVVVGRSPGLQWEIANIRARGHLAKALFLLPPVSAKELAKRLTVLSAALGLDPRILTVVGRQRPSLVRFSEPGDVVLHVTAARTTAAYARALSIAAARAQQQRGSVLSAPSSSSGAEPADVSTLLKTFDPGAVRRSRKSVVGVLADFALRV